MVIEIKKGKKPNSLVVHRIEGQTVIDRDTEVFPKQKTQFRGRTYEDLSKLGEGVWEICDCKPIGRENSVHRPKKRK